MSMIRSPRAKANSTCARRATRCCPCPYRATCSKSCRSAAFNGYSHGLRPLIGSSSSPTPQDTQLSVATQFVELFMLQSTSPSQRAKLGVRFALGLTQPPVPSFAVSVFSLSLSPVSVCLPLQPEASSLLSRFAMRHSVSGANAPSAGKRTQSRRACIARRVPGTWYAPYTAV